MVQKGFDTAPHASCLSDNLLYLAGPKLKGMYGEAVRGLGKINLSLFLAYLGEKMVEPVPSLPLNKSSAFAPQLGPGIGLRSLYGICPFCLTTVLAFLSLVKTAPDPLWIPKSCSVLTGLQFLISPVVTPNLHCLASEHLSPPARCLLCWGFPGNLQHCSCAGAAAWVCLLPVVLCSAIQRLVRAQRDVVLLGDTSPWLLTV